MIESFKEMGKWWLPDDSENIVSGILKFDPVNGIELKIFGFFEDKPTLIASNTDDFARYNIILGVIPHKKVTLYNCNQRSGNLRSPRFIEQEFSVNTLFLGHHFSNVKDIKFKNLSISYTNLKEWVGKSGFKAKPEMDSYYLKEYSLQFKYPKKIEVNLGKFQIVIDNAFKAEQEPFEFNLNQNTLIEIIPSDTTSFFELMNDICYHIQNFLSLGIGRAISPLSIAGENEDCKQKLPDGEVIYKPIEVYYAVKNPILTEKKVYPREMFFTLDDLNENFEEALKNWFEKAEDLKPVYDLYFGTLNNSSMYIELSFLSLIQALESYHRRMHKGNYLPKNQYKKVRKNLIEHIPECVTGSHRESLESKINFGNEFSLKTRLKEIFEEDKDLFSSLIKNEEEFIKDVKNTRNYLTHYDKKLERKAKKGQELFILKEKLNFMIEICFLKELGLPLNKIQGITSKNPKYDYIRLEE